MTTRTDLDAQTPPRADRTAAPPRRSTRLARRAVLAVAMAIAVAAGSQLIGSLTRSPVLPASSSDSIVDTTGGLAGLTGDAANGPAPDELDVGAGSAAANDADLVRIRANVTFWGGRLAAHPGDFVSAQKLGESQIELARATGDLTAYLAADQALATALTIDPDLPAATAYRGVVFVALHRFVDARALAQGVLESSPDDPTALATLGDASLELGELDAARTAYTRLAKVAPSAAASVRLGHLAFIAGDPASAVRFARAAVSQADDEETEGERAGFYRYQLADTLLATGDRAGAEAADRDALAHDPTSFLAHAGLGRALAADGDLGGAIAELGKAIAIIPQPDMLARRADLYQLRNAPGDAARASKDRNTVLAIAQLASAAGNVYDRTLSLYLANHGLDPQHAVDLAANELTVRKDVYGYDALAWALDAAGRPAEAETAMESALAFGTKDAKLLYHAGVIAADLGDMGRARAQLQAAVDLDPSFDALQAARAREILAALPMSR
jgi:tetratricopeptide (TPR) repeat protein